MARTAVLLMAYGGPDSLDDVQPYLLDVRGGRPTPPELVEEITGRYAAIGGKSPLLANTRAQAAALQAELDRRFGAGAWQVFVGMRHWHPYIREVVPDILAGGFERIVALCLTPFASRMSTQAYFQQLDQALEGAEGGTARVERVASWHSEPGFLQACAEKVSDAMRLFPAGEPVLVLFTAHSLPAALSEQGDPYAVQFEQTAAQVAQAAGLPQGAWRAGYQSAGASNGRWLGPSLEQMLDEAARAGARNVLVAPVGFVSDHVEILYDLDIETSCEARELGLRFARTEALNTSGTFITALADIVTGAAR